MGIGTGTGENRAIEAARQAISSPLLEVNIDGAQGILFNVIASSSLTLYEVNDAAEEIRSAADPEANIIFGTSLNERMADEIMITVIATGFEGSRKSSGLRREAAVDSGYSVRRRDFLSELESERTAASQVPTSQPAPALDEVGEPVMAPRRTTPYEADDLEIPSFLRRK
jgi:cell division protein FtsZ